MNRLSESNNRDNDIAILVVSCDAYQDLWHPFFHCLFKNWPDCPYPIFLGSNTISYSDSRVQPVMVGKDLDYSSNLINMLKQIPHEWVILWIEDRVLSAPVDTSRLIKMIQLAQSRGAGYFRLIAHHPFAWSKDKSQEISEIPKGSYYRSSITVALWRKSVLTKLIRPGETAWDLERIGSRRSDNLDEKFFCLTAYVKHNPPISDQHLIIKGRLLRDAHQFLQKEGLQEYLQQRRLQTLRSYWYVRLYIATLDIYDMFKWQNMLGSK